MLLIKILTLTVQFGALLPVLKLETMQKPLRRLQHDFILRVSLTTALTTGSLTFAELCHLVCMQKL